MILHLLLVRKKKNPGEGIFQMKFSQIKDEVKRKKGMKKSAGKSKVKLMGML